MFPRALRRCVDVFAEDEKVNYHTESIVATQQDWNKFGDPTTVTVWDWWVGGKANLALNPWASPQAPMVAYLHDPRTVRQLSQSDNIFKSTDLIYVAVMSNQVREFKVQNLI